MTFLNLKSIAKKSLTEIPFKQSNFHASLTKVEKNLIKILISQSHSFSIEFKNYYLDHRVETNKMSLDISLITFNV